MVFYKLKYVLLPKMREEQGKELRKCINLSSLKKTFMVKRGFVGSNGFMPFVGFVKNV